MYCERVYSPWPDLHKIMKEQQIPLFALETQDPIKDFDFLCMTLQYELCYPNILQILDLGGIPLKSADRTDHMPIVIGGGPAHTIRNRLLIFSISSISEKAKPYTMISLISMNR